MTVIELPDDLAAALKAKAEAQHLQLEDWFRTLTNAAPASGNNGLDHVFAEIRGQADDIDWKRDGGAVSVLDEMKVLRACVKPDPEGWSTRDYVQHGRR